MGDQAIPSDAIPLAVIYASFEAAFAEATNPGSLVGGGTSTTRVKRKKVGELEVEYQAATGTSQYGDDLTPILTTVYGLLKPYLVNDDRVPIGIWSIGPRYGQV